MVASVGIASEFELVTGTTGMVVSMDQLRSHLHYVSHDQDDAIRSYYQMAVSRIETECRRQLLTATWKLYFDHFPAVIQIRKCPVASITSIQYLDTDGQLQTLSTSIYDAFLQREPGETRLAYSQSYPITRQNQQAVTVTFVAGYGDSTDCPAQAKHAIKLMVEDAFHGTDKNEATVVRLLNQLNWGI